MSKWIVLFCGLIVLGLLIAIWPIGAAAGDAIEQFSDVMVEAQTAEAMERANAAQLRADERAAVSAHLKAAKVAGVWVLFVVGVTGLAGVVAVVGSRSYQEYRHNLLRAMMPPALPIGSDYFIVQQDGRHWLLDVATAEQRPLNQAAGVNQARAQQRMISTLAETMLQIAERTNSAQPADMVPTLGQLMQLDGGDS